MIHPPGLRGYVISTLIKYRKQDSFADNYLFIVALVGLMVAHGLILDPATFTTGYSLSLGLYRLAFVIMFERTLTQFMKNGLGTQLPRWPRLDRSIKIFVLLAAFQVFMPSLLAALVLFLAALLLLIRFCLWKPLAAFRRFEIGIMYLGYLGLVAHLLLEAAKIFSMFNFLGAIPVHVFTFLCMGLVISVMMIRICQGHTGRKLIFTLSDRIAIRLMLLAAFFRLVGTQIWPDHYLLANTLAALGWTLCFSILGIRLAPFLWQPRVDGRIR